MRAQKTIEDDQFISMRQDAGRVYAVARFSVNCRSDTNVKLVEILENLESKTIFQTSNVNSVEVTDFEITPEHFILVGRVRTFLPTSSIRLSLNLEELRDKRWGDSFWENNEDQLSALVLVVGRNGAFVGDRVFSGVATRAIQNVVALDSFRFVAAGSTFSDRGWIMSFGIQKPKGDLGSSIGTWLKGIGFGWAHYR